MGVGSIYGDQMVPPARWGLEGHASHGKFETYTHPNRAIWRHPGMKLACDSSIKKALLCKSTLRKEDLSHTILRHSSYGSTEILQTHNPQCP